MKCPFSFLLGISSFLWTVRMYVSVVCATFLHPVVLHCTINQSSSSSFWTVTYRSAISTVQVDDHLLGNENVSADWFKWCHNW